jgi:anti-sigma-K factor RskA
MNAHPQYAEDFELYALSVLDASDKKEFEAHLADCAECRANLKAARSRLALLALAAPESDPPPAVRERILDSFRTRDADRVKAAPPLPARRGPWAPMWGWVWAGVCFILLVAAVWLGFANLRLTKRLAELERSRQQLEAANVDLKAATARAQAVLDVLTAPQSVQVELSPAAARPEPHAKAFYNRDKGLLFYTTDLHSLPSGQTYELWLIPTVGNPVDLGIFNTDTQGNGEVILTSLPQGLIAKAFAVTVEPAGGVPAPTGTMVLVGPVS